MHKVWWSLQCPKTLQCNYEVKWTMMKSEANWFYIEKIWFESKHSQNKCGPGLERFMSSLVEEGNMTAMKVMLTSQCTDVKRNQKCWQAIIDSLAVCIQIHGYNGIMSGLGFLPNYMSAGYIRWYLLTSRHTVYEDLSHKLDISQTYHSCQACFLRLYWLTSHHQNNNNKQNI